MPVTIHTDALVAERRAHERPAQRHSRAATKLMPGGSSGLFGLSVTSPNSVLPSSYPPCDFVE